jgi:hypothetical protein
MASYSSFINSNGIPQSYIVSGYTGSASATIGFAESASATTGFTGSASATIGFPNSTLSALNQTYIPGPLGTTGSYIGPTSTGSGSTGPGFSTTYISYSGATGTHYNSKFGPGYIDTVINTIPHVGTKIIPKDSVDALTFDEIMEGDLLINFNRYSDKSEYDYDTFYKESTLRNILIAKKNPFTMKELDLSSFTKYEAKF